MKIFLTGATGFVGRNVLKRLLLEDHEVSILMRPGKSRLIDLGFGGEVPREKSNVRHVPGDVVSGSGLDQGMQGCDAAIHLVGIIVEKGSNTFDTVHHVGTRNVVEAAKRARIQRFVHMSALGVRENGVAEYQRSKWKAEEEVRRSGIPYCILRPSLIFGPGDGFVTQMMDLMKKAPLFRLVPGDGSPKFRPIFVHDVAFCFSGALTAKAATTQTVELGGADELTLNEVLAEIARCAGVTKPAVHIPMPLMFLGAALAGVLPNAPVTADQLRMLREGSTCDIEPMRRTFGLNPRGFSGCGRS
jgi:NADH dehydrogenase